MKHRIYNVLLLSSKYDAFILEEDGRIDEQIFNEYVSLHLRYPPRFTLVETEEDALTSLNRGKYELIITMSDSEDRDIIDLTKRIKALYPEIPIVVLTPFLREISVRVADEDLSMIDYFFCWLGNSDLLLAIIKLMEDRMNVEEDLESVGVQAILFVEDSIRFASSVLPYLYKFVFQQSRSFMTEALNEHQRMLRMRGRPKILMARTYDEAISIYDKFKHNILGVISDVDFPYRGQENKGAGIDLCRLIKAENSFMPYIIYSSEVANKASANEIGAAFVDKNNEKILPAKLSKQLLENFGFGDFVFENPTTGEEVARAKDLHDLQHLVPILPDDTVEYHFSRNHVSRWLYSRAMFPLAEFVKKIFIDDFDSLDEVRNALTNAIVRYRRIKNRGVVADFRRDHFDKYSNFTRIGKGSMGGKARGLAFLDSIIKRNPDFDDFEGRNVQITLPRTVVLCTDIFDEFMEKNNLYSVALSDVSNEEILRHFLDAPLPEILDQDLAALINAVNTPIAVRSSSLLEDSYYQPFAGIYSTYMLPYDEVDKEGMLHVLKNAIKAVYASVFYKESKAYIDSTSNVIDSEKMAVVLQEVAGREYSSGRYYPSFSGVARSINFYPISPELPEDGVCNLALGLGKSVVDGGVSLRFSPEYPRNILQTSELNTALRDTQTKFFAIDTSIKATTPTVNDSAGLSLFDLKAAEEDGSLYLIASTFDYNDRMIRDGIYDGGRKLVTFSNILKHDAFPLAPILQKVLKIGRNDMGHQVEIEFAVSLGSSIDEPSSFYLLQIRPIVENDEIIVDDLDGISVDDTIVSSMHSLGNGIIDNVCDFIYIKPETFDASKNQLTALEIEKLNEKFRHERKNYILAGPGRWGSSDPWLGIPVKWPQISAARLIIEAGMANYRVDPSQGTHFFHNLTSFRTGYFTVNSHNSDGYYDVAWLNAQQAVYESESLRHVRFQSPAIIKIDGKRGRGLVMKVK
jgi:DNA-binding NarL/FixJ family response regulator